MKKIKINNAFLQRGISLLEVLLSLTIIAIILVMAVRYFFLAANNNRINTTREQVGSVVAAIHGWKNQNPQYTSSLNLTELYNGGFITKSNSLVADNPPPNAGSVALYDPWGKEITVTGGDTNATISVTMPNSYDCTALLNSYPTGTCNDTGAFSLIVV